MDTTIDLTIDTPVDADPAYTRLLDRIEELQFELARLRAEAAKRQPYGDAVRRAKAFDEVEEPTTRRPCRSRAGTDPSPPATEAGTAEAVGPDATADRGRDEVGRDVCSTTDETALRAMSIAGRGAVFAGGRAAVRLLPADTSGPPIGGRAGDLHVDAEAALWYFGAGGWVRLA